MRVRSHVTSFFLMAGLSIICGLMLAPLVVSSAVPVGNERQEEYRAPWPERQTFARRDGCPVFAATGTDCNGHLAGGRNEWAVDMHHSNGSDCGTELRATRNGSVHFFDESQGGDYGNLLGINHVAFNGGTTSTWYAHQSYPNGLTNPWDTVFAQGDFIATMGTTGYSTGCHLHFQVDLGLDAPTSGVQQSTDVVLSGTPFQDGFDLQQFSDTPYPTSGSGDFRSNNTGPGYGRPGAPPFQDPGSATAPLSTTIRNYVRDFAFYGIDIGSTKASSRGVCGGNRRWVKSCQMGVWGTAYSQTFVSRGIYGDVVRAIVEGPGSYAYAVDGQYWKMYGVGCGAPVTPSISTSKFAYYKVGRPVSEDYNFIPNVDIQNFQGGTITKDYTDPGNIKMTVYLDGTGTICTKYGVLDLNNDPCYDVSTDFNVNPGDQASVASRVGQTENNVLFDDRFDVIPDGVINPGDQARVASQVPRFCK